MKISDLLSPLRRNKTLFWIVFLGLFIALSYVGTHLPKTQKSTVYFTVKPITTEEASANFDHAESTMKVAETIAGWAKNPAFRNEILKKAEADIKNFKRKITAKKQNRMNVFWTLKFDEPEIKDAEKVIESFLLVLKQRFATFNQDNAYPYGMTKPEVAGELRSFPQSWILLAAVFLSFALSIVLIYAKEALRGRVSHLFQIYDVFPASSLLQVPDHPKTHDAKLLERFLKSFEETPVLIGTFPIAFDALDASTDIKNWDQEIPILLVRMGDTTIKELENLEAIYGDEVGIVVFER